MTLDELQEMWTTDSVLGDDYRVASDNQPKLHAKYLSLLSKERILFKKLQDKKKRLITILEDYYLGKIDGRDIKRPAWQITETKTSAEKRVESDALIVAINIEIFEQEEKVNSLIEIVKNVSFRHLTIKNAIDWLRFTQGQ